MMNVDKICYLLSLFIVFWSNCHVDLERSKTFLEVYGPEYTLYVLSFSWISRLVISLYDIPVVLGD